MSKFETTIPRRGGALRALAACAAALALAGLFPARAQQAPPQALTITEEDSVRFQERHWLPDLERIGEPDRTELVDSRQVMRRIAIMGIDAESFQTPEASYKTLYNEVWRQVDERALQKGRHLAFTGASVSELNRFIETAGEDAIVEIQSEALAMDETLRVPTGVYVDGGGARLAAQGTALDRAVLLDGSENCGVEGLVIEGGCDYGIYVKNANSFALVGNEISGAACKGVAVMGDNADFVLANNDIRENGDGGIYLNGDVKRGVLEGNTASDNGGTDNMSAGIVLSSIRIRDIDTAYNSLEDILIYDILDSPNHLVFLNNTVSLNCSSGIYSHSGYCNYYIGNTVALNEKEGICLDHGTFGCYLSRNSIRGNGNRNRMSDEALKEDFVYDLGRLEDGSARPKLPGISMDNAAYNTLAYNVISQNYGSGVKAVRSCYRNVLVGNQILDNNQGVNEPFHFFGIELSSDENVDMQLQGFDCTPCYENIVARNVISGAHYAGIFLGAGNYVNDIFDNSIFGCTTWSMESLSSRLNASTNNISNVTSRGINLSRTGIVVTNPAQ